MITHHPISWWVDQLKENKYFSLARYGDGEFLCVFGRHGANSHGCRYTPELRDGLIKSLDAPILHGQQRLTPDMHNMARLYTKNGEWVDTELFADELAVGGLKPFFDALREKDIVLISSAEKRASPIPYKHFIETPRTNTYNERERIINEVLGYGKPATYLFACGMAACPLVAELHGKLEDSFIIDIGHILDPFLGENSRFYLNDVSKEILLKNL